MKNAILSKLQLNGLALKIIGLILMTIDHIGLFFLTTGSVEWIVLRTIGRMAMPIFFFLGVEAVYHSRNPLRYALVLIGLGVLFDLTLYLSNGSLGNIFTDLGIGALCGYLIKSKDLKKLLLLPLPIAFSVLSVVFPKYIHTDYGVFGLSIYLLFIAAYELTPLIIKTDPRFKDIDNEMIPQSYPLFLKKALCSIFLFTIVCVFHLIYRMDSQNILIPFSFNIQSWCVLAIPFILLYNGKRGFSNKITKYVFYAYYPLHILLFNLIFYLIA